MWSSSGKNSREMIINAYTSPVYLVFMVTYVAFLIWFVSVRDMINMFTEQVFLTFIAQTIIFVFVGYFYPVPRQTWEMLTLTMVPIIFLVIYRALIMLY